MNRPDLLLALESFTPSNNSIEKIYGLMLYGAVRHARPAVVLELGTAQGYSAAWMLLALSENEHGHLYTVDLIPADTPIWKQLGVPTDRLTYLSNEYIDSMREDKRLPAAFDLVFHDAGHNLGEVQKDLAWVLPRIAVGGSLVVHDTVYNPAIGEWMRTFFEHSLRADFWKYEQIDEASGAGIATRLKAEETTVCEEKSNGSTTLKATDLSREKTAKTISPISPKSSDKVKLAGRLRKTKTLYSSRQRKQRGPERVLSSSNGVE